MLLIGHIGFQPGSGPGEDSEGPREGGVVGVLPPRGGQLDRLDLVGGDQF